MFPPLWNIGDMTPPVAACADPKPASIGLIHAATQANFGTNINKATILIKLDNKQIINDCFSKDKYGLCIVLDRNIDQPNKKPGN